MSTLGVLGALFIGLSLGLLGSGGSILTVPVLLYLFDQPERLAIASSMAIVGAIAFAGALPNIPKRQVNWRCVILFGIPGSIGTYFGAFASQFVLPSVQLITFALVMLLASYFMLRTKVIDVSEPSAERSHLKITLDGLLVGILTGFVGVGGGFLIVPALVLLARLPMHQAVGTSLMIIAFKSITGFVKYLDVLAQEQLSLDWHTIILVSVVGILGSFSGNWLGSKIPQNHLKKGFALFLIPMAVFIISQNI
ncbi:sulfite exporter TauE/SafE family protein [Thalassotalea fusca]